MRQSTLIAFLDWLQPRSAQGTITQTIRQMVWGDTRPPVNWGLTPAPDGNWLQNPSLETVIPTTGIPECWEHYGSGNNTSEWDAGAPHSGAEAVAVNVDTYRSGVRGLMSKHDYGGCSPVLSEGHSYTLSAWYIAPENTPVFEIDYFYQGAWLTWLIGPRLAPSDVYTQAVWVTPPFPADAQVSVGLVLNSVGSLTVDDLVLEENP